MSIKIRIFFWQKIPQNEIISYPYPVWFDRTEHGRIGTAGIQVPGGGAQHHR